MTADLNLFGKMPSAEIRLIKAVLETDAEISLTVPDCVTPAQIFDQLMTLSGAIDRMDYARARLMAVVGHLMLLCQEHPETYTERGFSSWRDFLNRCIYMKFGWSRQHAYLAMQTVRLWPSLSVSEYAEIGIGKFNVLNRFSSQNGTSSRKLLAQAKKMTVRELREWAITTGRMERGEDRPAVITIGCNQKTRKLWEEFIRHQKTIEVAGSESPAVILEACVAEFCGEYGIGESK